LVCFSYYIIFFSLFQVFGRKKEKKREEASLPLSFKSSFQRDLLSVFGFLAKDHDGNAGENCDHSHRSGSDVGNVGGTGVRFESNLEVLLGGVELGCVFRRSSVVPAHEGLVAVGNVLGGLTGEGKNVLLEIEVEGARNVKEKCPDAIMIFITPPSMEELERRIRGRRTEPEEIVQQRLAKAAKEMQMLGQYKYVVCNDDADEAAEIISVIIRHNMKRN